MNPILLGNLISFAGAFLMVVIGLIKRKEKVLAVQCVQFSLMGIGNLVLGGVTGALSNLISLVRNLICYKFGITIPLKLMFIAVQAGLSLWVNTQGLIGLLPVLLSKVHPTVRSQSAQLPEHAQQIQEVKTPMQDLRRN